jgi:hypothetical protein
MSTIQYPKNSPNAQPDAFMAFVASSLTNGIIERSRDKTTWIRTTTDTFVMKSFCILSSGLPKTKLFSPSSMMSSGGVEVSATYGCPG